MGVKKEVLSAGHPYHPFKVSAPSPASRLYNYKMQVNDSNVCVSFDVNSSMSCASGACFTRFYHCLSSSDLFSMGYSRKAVHPHIEELGIPDYLSNFYVWNF